MLILDDPAAILTGQFHGEMNIRCNPLVIDIRTLPMFRRDFIQGRRMPLPYLLADFLSTFPVQYFRHVEIVIGA